MGTRFVFLYRCTIVLQPNTQTGLELIVSQLTLRYVWDSRGRMLSPLGGGVLPRFVLGRAAEGCVWRFGAELTDDAVRNVAKLAGRESGFGSGETLFRPERLEMISRLLGGEIGKDSWVREEIQSNERLVAEIFSFVG